LNTLFFQLNHGDPAPLKPLGINHVHRPTHAPPAAASVNQGVASSAEGYGWVVDGGEVFCAMLQAASAKAAKSTVTSGKGTVLTNVADYQKKDLQSAFTNASVTTSRTA
jgi:hypothetical protein